MTSEQKLIAIESLMSSPAWSLIETALEHELDLKDMSIRTALQNSDTHKLFQMEGMRLGIELCLATPEKIRRDNKRLVDKLREAIFGKRESAQNGA